MKSSTNLETDIPEVCVGQKVTFAMTNLPMDQIVNMVGNWQLPQKFVNKLVSHPIFGTPTPTSYEVNNGLLYNTNATSCWFVNGSNGKVGVNMNLHFTNGQYISIASIGNFTIYRPTFTNFINLLNYFTWDNPTLQANLSWRVTLNSKYDGLFGITQLINANGGNYDTSGNDFLDGNSEIYGEADGPDGPKQYFANVASTHATRFLDSPSTQTVYPPCPAMLADFKDYLRFQPSGGDNIYITIATNGWHMDGQACPWSGVEHTNLPPASASISDDSFPFWYGVRHVLHGN